MNVKSLYKYYYHQLYDAIKYLDREAINRSSESAIRLLNKNIDQLSAFISLLTYVDETIPLIRCQGALGKFKKDFIDLYLSYLEENLVKSNPVLFDENKQIDQILSREESLSRDRYSKSVHELYLNTIHATEKVVIDHINQMNEDKLGVKTHEYFRNLVEVYLEHLQEGDFDSLDLILAEIYYNLLLFRETKPIESGEYQDEELDHLLDTLHQLKEMLLARKLYHDTARKLQFYGAQDEEMDKDLLNKMRQIENGLIRGGGYLESFGDKLLSYLSQLLWIESGSV